MIFVLLGAAVVVSNWILFPKTVINLVGLTLMFSKEVENEFKNIIHTYFEYDYT